MAALKINRNTLIGLGIVVLFSGIFLVWPIIKNFVSQKSFALGNYYFSGQSYNLERAKEFYRLSLKANPDLPGVHYQLARIYFLQDKSSILRWMQSIGK